MCTPKMDEIVSSIFINYPIQNTSAERRLLDDTKSEISDLYTANAMYASCSMFYIYYVVHANDNFKMPMQHIEATSRMFSTATVSERGYLVHLFLSWLLRISVDTLLPVLKLFLRETASGLDFVRSFIITFHTTLLSIKNGGSLDSSKCYVSGIDNLTFTALVQAISLKSQVYLLKLASHNSC